MKKEDFLSTIRGARNVRLQASDWTALTDCSLSDEQKAEWVAYRTELRNFTDQYKNLPDNYPFDLYSVRFPEPPSGG